MKKFNKAIALSSLLFTLLFANSLGWSQSKHLILDKPGSKMHTTTLLSDKSDEISVKFNLNEIILNEVKTDNGTAYTVISVDAPNTQDKGNPDLLNLTGTVIIPETGKTEIEVIPGDFVEYFNIEIAPSKGVLTRNINPANVPFEKGKAYSSDEFFPGNLAFLREPYVLRDFRGQTVEVNPVQYNPVSKVLRVYKEVIVKIHVKAEKGLNEFVDSRKNKKVYSEFDNIYRRNFLNYSNYAKYTPVNEEGRLLVVAHSNYMEAMKPFVNWKNQKGQPTTLINYTTAGGTVAGLTTYIANQYNSEAGLMFVLLVGDGNQVGTIEKTLSGTTPSPAYCDPAYGFIVGTDAYAEVFVGRFSGESVADIETQVARAITYERDLTTSDTWLKNGLGLASDEGGGSQGDNGESDVQHMNLIRTKLLGYNYTAVDQVYDPGATAATVVANLNAGRGIANYVGHGSDTYWVTSGFGVSNMTSLTNVNKLPFVFDVACVNGRFVGQTCFAEGFVRAKKTEGPTGALAIIAGSINQSWNSPMCGQDEMNNILAESYASNIKRTFGGITVNGCLKMNDSYSTDGFNMTNTWVIFGDPSVVVRTNTPSEMVISHNPTMFLGASSFSVNCDTDGALVAISYVNSESNVVLLGTGVSADGSATVVFTEPIVEPLDMTVTVTAYNKVTYSGLLSAVPADEPYVVLNSFSTTASPNYGAQVGINVTLENISEVPYTATNVTATITTESTYATIINGSAEVGTIDPAQVVNINDIFEFAIANNVPDQTPIVFTISLTGEYNEEVYEWAQNFIIKANAPVISIGNLTIDDAGQGTPNYLEPGETASVKVILSNTGGAGLEDVNVKLLAESLFLTITDGAETASVAANATTEVIFTVEANEATPSGLAVELGYTAEKDIFSANGSKTINIGALPQVVVGGGTIDTPGTAYYPLDNYYKANRTQMLYLKSEVSATPQVITHLALDIKSIGTVSSYKNLTIKLMETATAVMPGSFVATTSAITVFTAATYTMPTVTGWHTFDITDFAYSGTANLLVEVSFGINDEWTSTRYRVNCTTTPAISVAYGYDDYTALPTYDGNSSIRPNIFLSFQTEVATSYSANFTVIDGDDNALEGVEITIGSKAFETNLEGNVAIELPSGQYSYTASKDGFDMVTGQFTIEDAGEQVLVVLGGTPKYQLEIAVNNAEFGTVSGSGYYYADEEVELVATPADGYEFVNWTNADEEVLSTLSTFTYTMPSESTTVTANFAIVISTNIGSLTSVNVFPNPFTSKISVSGASKVKTIVVSSILGQELVRLPNSGNESIEIPTAMLSQGVYLVTLIGEANETRVSKMIKK